MTKELNAVILHSRLKQSIALDFIWKPRFYGVAENPDPYRVSTFEAPRHLDVSRNKLAAVSRQTRFSCSFSLFFLFGCFRCRFLIWVAQIFVGLGGAALQAPR